MYSVLEPSLNKVLRLVSEMVQHPFMMAKGEGKILADAMGAG